MAHEVCGSSPWKGTPTEVHAALELARRGKLPTGPDSWRIDVVKRWQSVYEEELNTVLKPDNEIQ